jgi:glycosyltransferase involved in cell wall biosynthesis
MGILNIIDLSEERIKTSWPWNVETDSNIYSDSIQWPKITIITPSYNQGNFLEETIRSIILQNYPNLEYIIIDGGSTDNSIEIIKKYENHLTYWVSEKDFGQSHAINKGIFISTGELINWINSDDILMPNSLFNLAMKFIQANTDRIVIIGNGYEIDVNSEKIRERKVELDPTSANKLYFKIKGVPIQQAMFFSKRILTEAGGINPLMKYPMDIDLYNKLGFLNPRIEIVDQFIGGFRLHSNSKTISQSILMLDEKINLLKFLSFYDKNKTNYKNQIASYIIGTSLSEINLFPKMKYIFQGFINLKLNRKNRYKFRILFSKVINKKNNL